MRRRVALLSLLAVSALSNVAFAGAWDWGNQAVSAPNLAVSAQGGTLNGDGAGVLSATGSIPVGERYGLQIDALYGEHAHSEQMGMGAHFFYRDPSRYLLGATAMTSEENGVHFSRYGAEGEVYYDQFTIAPAAGIQRGHDALDNTWFYTLDGSYYPNDNLKLTLGSTGFSDVQALYGEAEWQPTENTPFTVFANAGGADEGHGFALAGVRYTFGAGETTSIKHRDRTGDPSNIVKTALQYLGSAIDKVSNQALTNNT